MPKNTTDNLRDAVNNLGQSAPIIRIGKAIGKVGEYVESAADNIKSTFAPLLPGQTDSKRKTK